MGGLDGLRSKKRMVTAELVEKREQRRQKLKQRKDVIRETV